MGIWLGSCVLFIRGSASKGTHATQPDNHEQLFKSHGEMAAKTGGHIRSNLFKKLHGRQGNEVVNLPSVETVLVGFDRSSFDP